MSWARAAAPGEAMDDAAASLLAFLQDVGDSPEVLWCAGLAMLDRAVADGREGRHSRFRHHPRGQLRLVRRELAQGLKLMRLAVALQEAERETELDVALRVEASAAAKKRRRKQTLPAQLARLEKQRRTREGLPVSNFHLTPEYLARRNGDG
jgi:hypothetical protein